MYSKEDAMPDYNGGTLYVTKKQTITADVNEARNNGDIWVMTLKSTPSEDFSPRGELTYNHVVANEHRIDYMWVTRKDGPRKYTCSTQPPK